MMSSQGTSGGQTIEYHKRCWDPNVKAPGFCEHLDTSVKMFAAGHVNLSARPMTQGHEGNKNYRLFNPTRSRSKRAEQMSMFPRGQTLRTGDHSQRFGSMQQQTEERNDIYRSIQTPTTAGTNMTRRHEMQNKTMLSI